MNGQSQIANRQSGRRVWAREMQMVMGLQHAGKTAGRVRPVAVSSFMQNKANLWRFWPENADLAQEQTQSKPISRSSGLWCVRVVVSRPSGSGVRGTPCRFAPNKANFRGLWPGNWVWVEEQTQYIWRKTRRLSPLCGRSVGRRNLRLSPLTLGSSGLMMARSERNLEPGFLLDRSLVWPNPCDEPLGVRDLRSQIPVGQEFD